MSAWSRQVRLLPKGRAHTGLTARARTSSARTRQPTSRRTDTGTSGFEGLESVATEQAQRRQPAPTPTTCRPYRHLLWRYASVNGDERKNDSTKEHRSAISRLNVGAAPRT